MFTREVAINQFQLGLFTKIAADIPEESLYTPAAGHGHLPVWVLGHLAICAEVGQQMLGGQLTHPEWLTPFAPGSSGAVEKTDALSKQALIDANLEGYAALRQLTLEKASDPLMDRPHGMELLADTPIQTIGDLTAVLLTNHFGFHSAQLSSCRREAGFRHLF
ncbi:DinB family protein [Lignipirellula cremea]|uniref:DinB superfamily protein n=1 Tax=Lignipirellula cremea TaxID=2528010 RepID=A0A518DLZ2_9BACT|nr:DinB family protein [Lignipirellula cremea]QDU92859.1 hypothetical protein Pla8534_06320 [Lignipirellula cremea]